MVIGVIIVVVQSCQDWRGIYNLYKCGIEKENLDRSLLLMHACGPRYLLTLPSVYMVSQRLERLMESSARKIPNLNTAAQAGSAANRCAYSLVHLTEKSGQLR